MYTLKITLTTGTEDSCWILGKEATICTVGIYRHSDTLLKCFVALTCVLVVTS